jgi:hypothetical protein
MTQIHLKLTSGDGVSVYNADQGIVLQVRRLVHGDDDPTANSFKSGVVLTPAEATRVAAELLAIVGRELRKE